MKKETGNASRENRSLRFSFIVFILLLLTLCLLMSACSTKDYIFGEVVETTPAALILETRDDQRVAVLMDENTRIIGMEGQDGYDYIMNSHSGVKVGFFPKERVGSVSSSDGTKVKSYRTDTPISISAYLVPDAAVLSDGTVLDVWKSPSCSIYQTRDGVELLRASIPNGPQNYYVVDLESFDDLCEEAKTHVAAFYEKQGTLYDLQAELERAWAAYQTSPEGFTSFFVSQDTFPAAFSEQVAYFVTELSRTVESGIGLNTTLCAAFDRETGESIPLADLFLCLKEEIGISILNLAEKSQSNHFDPTVKSEMKEAFQLEYLSFSRDSLWVTFPQGSLPSQEYPYLVSVEFSEDCMSLLQPWAVPHQSPQ